MCGEYSDRLDFFSLYMQAVYGDATRQILERDQRDENAIDFKDKWASWRRLGSEGMQLTRVQAMQKYLSKFVAFCFEEDDQDEEFDQREADGDVVVMDERLKPWFVEFVNIVLGEQTEKSVENDKVDLTELDGGGNDDGDDRLVEYPAQFLRLQQWVANPKSVTFARRLEKVQAGRGSLTSDTDHHDGSGRQVIRVGELRERCNEMQERVVNQMTTLNGMAERNMQRIERLEGIIEGTDGSGHKRGLDHLVESYQGLTYQQRQILENKWRQRLDDLLLKHKNDESLSRIILNVKQAYILVSDEIEQFDKKIRAKVQPVANEPLIQTTSDSISLVQKSGHQSQYHLIDIEKERKRYFEKERREVSSRIGSTRLRRFLGSIIRLSKSPTLARMLRFLALLVPPLVLLSMIILHAFNRISPYELFKKKCK